MRNIWVISDTHFGHENIIKYCDRPFANSKEMDDCMLTYWNETVKETDKVYHLGDVYFGRGTGEYILPKLKGKKRLILGNHDHGKDPVLHANFEKIDVWRMFSEFELLLTHVPVHTFTLGEKLNRRGQPVNLTNVHGHIHNHKINDEKYRCVCVEHTNYRPVHIEELMRK